MKHIIRTSIVHSSILLIGIFIGKTIAERQQVDQHNREIIDHQ